MLAFLLWDEMSLSPLLEEGITLFDEEKYWECHEFFEDLWLEDQTDPHRFIYWAIIQVATSLYHLREENLNGAIGMAVKAQEKLQKCRKLQVITDEFTAKYRWDELEKRVMPITKTSQMADFLSLSKFKFRGGEKA